MFERGLLSRINRRRGSVLVVSVILSVSAAMTAVLLVKTMVDHQRINTRRRDIARAFFAAEAGVAQVLHWSNFPEDYDGGGTSGYFYRDYSQPTWPFPNLSVKVPGAASVTVDSAKLRTLTSGDGYESAHISSIILESRSAADPVACYFKARCTGMTPSGLPRTILVYLEKSPVLISELKLGGALISLATAAQGGNAKVHWGEAWTRSDVNMPAKSQSSHIDKTSGSYDKFVSYRSEGSLLFDTTWKVGSGKDLYDPATRTSPGDAPASGAYSDKPLMPDGANRLYTQLDQHVPVGTLKFPDMLGTYSDFKVAAKQHGCYYGTDAAGNIYRDGIKDAAHLVDFNTEFGNADRVNDPYTLLFIDTIDGTAPKADGSNLATISNSGTGVGMKGVFWIGANMLQKGAGNPASLLAESPDTGHPKVNLSKVYLDGVLYCAGYIDVTGNPVVYGSVVAEKDFRGSGTFDVWYNWRLKDGLQLPQGNVGSNFHIVLQENHADSPSI
ncbi:MAG TPA: hypothetical protein PKH31_03125 [Candidatus Sumerlaeota bacterium]|nr:hypothetical protein [Candidatus Sumerlaeota bacterium]